MVMIIDISHHQDPEKIDYDKLFSQVDGVIVRACYGTRVERAFERHYAEAKKRNIPVGTYHYIVEYDSVERQVAHMASQIAGKEFELGYWCDVELEKNAPPLTKQTVHAYLHQVEIATGHRFDIYTSQSMWKQIMGGAYYTDRKLWVAHYTTSSNILLPTGWGTWWMHQYTSSGRLEGYNGPLDLNRFNGTKAEFDAWVSSEEPEPLPPPLEKLYYPCSEHWRISQYFGSNPSWYPTSRGHNGIDFAIPVGNPIFAAADGVVEVARADTFGYGRHIRIRHAHGITIYGHMSRNDVKVGDKVKAKQIIGLSGGAVSDPYSGFSTGPHLHFEYRWDIPAPQVPGGYVYNAVDPLPLLTSHEQPVLDDAIGEVKMSGHVTIRTGPSVSYTAVGYALNGNTYEVYEVSENNWYRLDKGWISGNTQWTAFELYDDGSIGDDPVVPPEPPVLTLEQRVSRIEKHLGLE